MQNQIINESNNSIIMNTFGTFTILLGLASILGGVSSQLKIQERKPNIIIIYTDDMGIGDASFHNGQVEETPNIDQLARNGKVFTKYYTPAPVCSPSRVNVLTGMYHIRWGINTFLSSKNFNEKCEQLNYLQNTAPSIAKMMKSVDYHTAHFGKWHMGGGRDVKDAPSIHSYGFEEYASTYESPDPDPLLTSTDWIWAKTDSIKRWERTAYFVDKTLEFIKDNEDPVFVNLWPDDVHTPWVPSEQSLEENRETYFNLPNLRPVLKEFDQQIGRLVKELDAMGELENTMIIFTSDNGPAPSFERLRTNGLRGVKNSLYEGGVNMPMIVHWPEKIKKGQIDSTSVIASIDLYPTLAGIVGAEIPSGYQLDGEDFSEALFSSTIYPRKKPLFFEYGRNHHFRFPKNTSDISLPLAIREQEWKLLSNAKGDSIELFHLATDPYETNNLAQKKPAVVRELTEKLTTWFEKNDKSEIKYGQ